jgi:hypothetical protein
MGNMFNIGPCDVRRNNQTAGTPTNTILKQTLDQATETRHYYLKNLKCVADNKKIN